MLGIAARCPRSGVPGAAGWRGALAATCAAGVLCLSAGSSLGVPLAFDAPFRSYDTGANPVAVALADFDADGANDMAVANEDSNSVTIWLGNGDGTFRERRDLPTGPETTGVAVADLNGDGFQDLVAASAGSNTVSVWAGHGDGSFTALTVLTAGEYPIAATLADLNGDARADIVTTNFALGVAGSISVLLGRGDGTFGPRSDFATGTGPTSVAIGDLDHDGHVDLVSANAGGEWTPALSISVLLGRGDGTFQPKVDYPVATAPVGIALGDLDADGHLDAAVAGQWGGISILMGRADGTFGSARNYWTLEEQWAIAIADFDVDGHLDVLVGNADSHGITTYLGRGDGTFWARCDAVTGSQPYGLAVGRFDPDDRLDVAVANYGCDAVSVHLGHGDGSFGGGTALVTSSQPAALAARDLNGDGRPELLTANSNAATISVWIARADGSFAPKCDSSVGSTPVAVVLEDVDRDGQVDVVVANSGANTISVLLGRGDATFEPLQPFDVGIAARFLASGDFNGDMAPDVAVANGIGQGPIPVPYEPDSTLALYLGRGDGTFEPRVGLVADPDPAFLAVADVNEDTFVDLVVVSQWSNSVSLFAGHGDGTFESRRRIAAVNSPSHLALEDLDADGHLDIALSTGAGLSIFCGDGAGSFTLRLELPLPNTPESIALGDLDGDGALDMVLPHLRGNRVMVLRGRGDATFAEPLYFGTEGGPGAVVIADMDGNGSLDLAAIAPYADRLSVLRNANAVPALVSDFSASTTPGLGVHLSWRLASSACADLATVAVQRATTVGGPYTECADSPLVPAPAMALTDPQVEPDGVYWYRLELRWQRGARTIAGPVSVHVPGIEAARTVLYPPLVPFEGGPVTIRYSLAPGAGRTQLCIYDVTGRLVWDAGASLHEPGEHSQVWDRSDARGRPAARGVYFVRLSTAGVSAVRKLVLSRSAAGGGP